MENENEYLFHYTSVQSLAMILKNKSIRFNSLNMMDDLQEGKTADKQNYGRFCLISSWTSEEAESIPMWRMYTPKDGGIRISMRKNPFELSENIPDTFRKFGLSIEDNSNGNLLKTVVPLDEMLEKKIQCLESKLDKMLYQVEYTDDKERIYPKILNKQDDGGVKIAFDKLGIFKNKYWSFQKEWRYRLRFIPLDSLGLVTKGDEVLSEWYSLLEEDKLALPFDSYNLKISTESFEDMKITMSPTISEANKILLYSLVKEYNQDAQIKESELFGLLN